MYAWSSCRSINGAAGAASNPYQPKRRFGSAVIGVGSRQDAVQSIAGEDEAERGLAGAVAGDGRAARGSGVPPCAIRRLPHRANRLWHTPETGTDPRYCPTIPGHAPSPPAQPRHGSMLAVNSATGIRILQSGHRVQPRASQ